MSNDQCAEAEHVASWREYMAKNQGWQSERTPNVYREGFIAGMKFISDREPVQVGTLKWTRQAMASAGHTCVLTQTTCDGTVPPPCKACEESR